MNLIPAPNGPVTCSEQVLRLPLQPGICAGQEANGAAALLVQRMQQYCGVTMYRCASPQGAAIHFVRVQKNSHGQPAGWYRLEVSCSGIVAEYTEEAGLHAAAVSLYQLLRQAYMGAGTLACIRLEDWPRYPHRGLHLDTARHFFSVEAIERIIEQISLLKMNVLHWHFADDQAWRLQIAAYPALTASCGNRCYTRQDVQRLVEYARRRGVEILPEIEIPGHSTAAIAAYPVLSCRQQPVDVPKTGGIFPIILCAGKSSTYTFLQEVLEEVCSLFPGPRVHLGGDEAPKKEWEACPCCRAKRSELGLTSWEELQGHMLNYAADIVKAHGKQAVCWNEGVKASCLKPEIAVQYWMEIGRNSYCLPQAAADRSFVYSNVKPLYFDYPHSVFPLRQVYTAAPHIKKQDFSGAAGTLGLECAVWTERIATREMLESMLFPRTAAVAETAWSMQRSYPSFCKRLSAYYSHLAAAGITATPLHLADVRGLRRAAENLRFFAAMLNVLKEIKTSAKKANLQTQERPAADVKTP